jgi:hypothetical protein
MKTPDGRLSHEIWGVFVLGFSHYDDNWLRKFIKLFSTASYTDTEIDLIQEIEDDLVTY